MKLCLAMYVPTWFYAADAIDTFTMHIYSMYMHVHIPGGVLTVTVAGSPWPPLLVA